MKKWKDIMKVCDFDGCGRKVVAKSLCSGHWQQQRNNKDLTKLMKDITPFERFMNYVSKPEGESGCWIWTASLDKDGYGHFYMPYKTKAHIFSYEYYHGKKTKPLIRHTCHNPSCVNPEHLLEGTNQDNMDDMVKSGRSRKGEDVGISKLTEIQVREIRELYPKIKNYSKIGRMYGVSDVETYMIIKPLTHYM